MAIHLKIAALTTTYCGCPCGAEKNVMISRVVMSDNRHYVNSQLDSDNLIMG